MALNAPLVLLFLYGFSFIGLLSGGLTWYYQSDTLYAPTHKQVWAMILALLILGAGLALLGVAYLHDVWYC